MKQHSDSTAKSAEQNNPAVIAYEPLAEALKAKNTAEKTLAISNAARDKVQKWLDEAICLQERNGYPSYTESRDVSDVDYYARWLKGAEADVIKAAKNLRTLQTPAQPTPAPVETGKAMGKREQQKVVRNQWRDRVKEIRGAESCTELMACGIVADEENKNNHSKTLTALNVKSRIHYKEK